MDDSSKTSLIKEGLPSAILLVILVIIGIVLDKMGQDIHWPGYLSMVLFYVVIFVVGTYAAHIGRQKQKDLNTDSTDTMMLAGRSVPLMMAVFTMSATWVGGGYINGTAEYAYNPDYGLVWAQAPWGYAISLILGGLFFAKKMRRHEFKTMLDPFERRYGKGVAGVLYLPALMGETFWTAAILTALGSTFGTVLGLDFTPSIILSAAVAIAYTALGGLWAVALTDMIQMVLLLVGLFLVLPFALDHVGGWDWAWQTYEKKMGPIASFLPSKAALGNYFYNWWDYAFLLMMGGIPWHVYFQRVLSSKDENTAQRLSIIAGLVCILAAIPASMIGIIGNVVDWTTVGLSQAPEAAQVLPNVVRYLTNPWVATIGLGAIAAAVMSSVDSSILSASSMAGWNVFRPLYSHFKKKEVEPKSLAKVIQGCIWIVGIAATLIALRKGSVYELWFLCSDFVYCILFPQLVLALYDKKANTIGSICGFIVAAILRFGGGESSLGIPDFFEYHKVFGMPELYDAKANKGLFPFRTLAMVSSLITIMVVSRLTQKISPPRSLEKTDV
tara:strand:+ start:14696 stop:16363 length:1668 start_codon:yes stop_codon:yes gene_type:complete